MGRGVLAGGAMYQQYFILGCLFGRVSEYLANKISANYGQIVSNFCSASKVESQVRLANLYTNNRFDI